MINGWALMGILLSTWGSGTLPGMPLLKALMGSVRRLRDYYPELVHRNVVLNAPPSFSALFGTIAPPAPATRAAWTERRR